MSTVNSQFGPDKPCQRTGACTEAAYHLGGAHIDPRHALYDGPYATVNALPYKARDAARVLLSAGAPVPEVIDMANEILRLRDQVAAVRVDMDRQVSAAMRRADDCVAHGEEIVQLNKSVQFFDEQARKNDAGRIAVLGLLHQVEETISAMAVRTKLGQALPTTAELLDALAKAAKKTSAAHDRAWKK